MCLSTVDKEPKRKRGGIGYKIVEKREDGYYCWDCIIKAGKIKYPLGEWLTDPNHKPIMSYGVNRYPAGFHVYLELSYEMTRDYPCHCGGKYIVIVKCQFSRIVATGTDHSRETIIARRVKVLEEVGGGLEVK